MSVTATQYLHFDLGRLLKLVRREGAGPSYAENTVAGGCGDTRLDSVALDMDGAVAQVSHRPRNQRHDAGLADPDPATEGHLHAHLLARLEQGGRTVPLGGAATRTESDSAAFAAGTVELDGEPLHVQLAGQMLRLPHLLGGVEHRRWATHPRLTFDPVGHHLAETFQREHPHRVGELLVHTQ